MAKQQQFRRMPRFGGVVQPYVPADPPPALTPEQEAQAKECLAKAALRRGGQGNVTHVLQLASADKEGG